jgi:hypothetical protein
MRDGTMAFGGARSAQGVSTSQLAKSFYNKGIARRNSILIKINPYRTERRPTPGDPRSGK